MDKKCLDKILQYYKQRPDLFVEEVLGNKLSLYQRVILRALNAKENLKGRILSKTIDFYYRILCQLVSLDEDSKIIFYENKEYKEMTRDEAIDYVYNKLRFLLRF